MVELNLDTPGLDGEDWPKRTDDRLATINAEPEPSPDDDADVE